MGLMRTLAIPTIAAVLGLAVLLNLGFWQLDRLSWKEQLIEKVELGVNAPPVAAPGPETWQNVAEADDYRRVSIAGEFLPGKAFYYIALSDPIGPVGGPGKMVYSPFKTSDGWVVLLNRGFLPQGLATKAEAEATVAPQGPIEVTGLLRLSETPKWTTPAASDGLWFARDTNAMAVYLGIPGDSLAPYSIDLEANFTPASGLPQSGETIVRFKNDHLGYALTWFGLAATLIGVYLAYAASLVWPRKETVQK